LSPAKRGLFARQSPGETASRSVTVPVRNPRPSGLNGTKAIPSSRHAVITVASGSRVQSEYSDWSAVIGWTACARRSVATDTSESPRKRTLPAATNSLIAPTDSSIGTSRSTRWR
jgi:hypothetical protein